MSQSIGTEGLLGMVHRVSNAVAMYTRIMSQKGKRNYNPNYNPNATCDPCKLQ